MHCSGGGPHGGTHAHWIDRAVKNRSGCCTTSFGGRLSKLLIIRAWHKSGEGPFSRVPTLVPSCNNLHIRRRDPCPGARGQSRRMVLPAIGSYFKPCGSGNGPRSVGRHREFPLPYCSKKRTCTITSAVRPPLASLSGPITAQPYARPMVTGPISAAKHARMASRRR